MGKHFPKQKLTSPENAAGAFEIIYNCAKVAARETSQEEESNNNNRDEDEVLGEELGEELGVEQANLCH